jgi:LemA protein
LGRFYFINQLKMTSSLVLWSMFAIAVFWSVGVYNRLMRMRAKGLEAMGAVSRYLQRYEALVDAHLGRNIDEVAPEWRDLRAALSTLHLACSAVRASPLDVDAVQSLASGYQALQSAWSVLRESPTDLAGHRVPEGLQIEWERISQKVMHARSKYHQIATEYNHGLAQFPASLFVRIAGFKSAGTL